MTYDEMIDGAHDYVDPDTLNTNHPFNLCALQHAERHNDPHCWDCGGEMDNGLHTKPYGNRVVG